MHIKEQGKNQQYSLTITIDNQKRKLICRAPTKAEFILHEYIIECGIHNMLKLFF